MAELLREGPRWMKYVDADVERFQPNGELRSALEIKADSLDVLNRAATPSRAALGLSNKGLDTHMSQAKTAFAQAYARDSMFIHRLSPRDQIAHMTAILEKEVPGAIIAVANATGKSEKDAAKDMVAVSNQEMGASMTAFKAVAGGLGHISGLRLRDTEGLKKFAQEQYEALSDATRIELTGKWNSPAAEFAWDQMKGMLEHSGYGDDFLEFARTGSGDARSNKFLAAAAGEDEQAARVLAHMRRNPDKFREAGENYAMMQQEHVTRRSSAGMSSEAKRELGLTAGIDSTKIGDSNFSKYREMLGLYATGNVSSQRQASRMALELSGGMTSEQVGALRGVGGGGAAQIAGLHAVSSLSSGMDAAGWKKARKGIVGGFGYDIFATLSEQQKSRLQKDLESGGGMDYEEISNIKDILREKGTNAGIGERRSAQQSINERLMGELNTFAGTNVQFVAAVMRLNGKDTEADTVMKQLEASRQASNNFEGATR